MFRVNLALERKRPETDKGTACRALVYYRRARGVTGLHLVVFRRADKRFSPVRIAQDLQRLLLDLANTLARYREHVAKLLEGVIALLFDAEALAQNGFLPRREH